MLLDVEIGAPFRGVDVVISAVLFVLVLARVAGLMEDITTTPILKHVAQ